jgi:hypothetical protein
MENNNWAPTDKEKDYIRLIMSMCIDCLRTPSRGPKERSGFTENLRLIAISIDNIQE